MHTFKGLPWSHIHIEVHHVQSCLVLVLNHFDHSLVLNIDLVLGVGVVSDVRNLHIQNLRSFDFIQLFQLLFLLKLHFI